MRTIPIATFHTKPPARKLQEQLTQAGLESTIKDESRLERFVFLSPPRAAIHVEVEDTDFLKAKELIERLEASGNVMAEAVHCPECGSSRIEFPQISRKFSMPAIEAVLMAVHIVPREFYCLDCHYTWPLEYKPDAERDLLGWPRKPSETSSKKDASTS